MTRRDIRIATVYGRARIERSAIRAMDVVHWLRFSEGLADLGFSVDMIVDAQDALGTPRPTLRYVPPSDVEWSAYHVVKAFYPPGIRAVLETGGEQHPFISAVLASVVGPTDDTPGVHFFGEERRIRWELHQAIQRRARYVTLHTPASRALWEAEFGPSPPVLLLVPTATDREVPPPGRNPFPASALKNAVYVGNIYQKSQREVNLLWQRRLNALGTRLLERRVRLHFLGPGRTDHLDPRVVTIVGSVPYDATWDYQYFADVGIVLAQGPVQNNESSKLYNYLRAGLPVVSEAPVPNNFVLSESGLGLIAPYGDDDKMADMIEEAASRCWDRRASQRYILAHHTWERRMEVYERVLTAEFGV